MVEMCIDWGRPQMVGDYYPPYRTDVSDAIMALETVYEKREGGYEDGGDWNVLLGSRRTDEQDH